MRILVAEDDVLSRVLLERILQRAGYEVTAVENGNRAIAELTNEDPPRLALLDWIMPEKDGIEVCHEVRRRKGRAYTYMILLSSRETKREIVQGLESGADDYLTKPFDADELKARVRAGERILELEDRLVEARESMRFQATHDQLTSLWNRAVTIELLSREMARSKRDNAYNAVMMCDLDHFKEVNDQYGHVIGDEVLREVSRRLQNSVRSYDVVGRYGGEEFLVMLTKCDPSNAISRAENLRTAICSKPIHTSTHPLGLTISIGLALSSEFPHHDVDEIIHEADVALYAAKTAGRNCLRLAQPDPKQKKSVPGAQPTQVNF